MDWNAPSPLFHKAGKGEDMDAETEWSVNVRSDKAVLSLFVSALQKRGVRWVRDGFQVQT